MADWDSSQGTPPLAWPPNRRTGRPTVRPTAPPTAKQPSAVRPTAPPTADQPSARAPERSPVRPTPRPPDRPTDRGPTARPPDPPPDQPARPLSTRVGANGIARCGGSESTIHGPGRQLWDLASQWLGKRYERTRCARGQPRHSIPRSQRELPSRAAADAHVHDATRLRPHDPSRAVPHNDVSRGRRTSSVPAGAAFGAIARPRLLSPDSTGAHKRRTRLG